MNEPPEATQPGYDSQVFRRIRSKRLYEEVIEQILALIAKGEIKLGGRLPTERYLEEVLGVSRGVLREAFRVLEARGIIESRPGGGRFLRSIPGDQETRHPDLKLEQAAILDIWEVREALEPHAAALAARRARPDQIAKLKALAEAALAAPPTSEARFQTDFAFHRAVAEASGNALLARLIDQQLSLLEGMRERVIARVGRRSEDIVRDYLDIALAVEDGDPERARYHMIHHLSLTRRKYERKPPNG